MKSYVKLQVIGALSILAVVSVLATPVARAATTYELLAPLPCIQGNGVTCANGNGSLQTKVDLPGYIQYAFNLFIALAAVVAVYRIVWGGFKYMTSQAWQNKNEGRETATHAIYGLLLILCSWLILRTINPKFVEIDLRGITPLKVQPSAWSRYYSTVLPQLTEMMRNANIDSQQMQQQATAINGEVTALQNQMIAAGCVDGAGNPTGDYADIHTDTDPGVDCAALYDQMNGKIGQANQLVQQAIMTQVSADVTLYQNALSSGLLNGASMDGISLLDRIEKARALKLQQLSASAYGGNVDPQNLQQLNQSYDQLVQTAAAKALPEVFSSKAMLSELQKEVRDMNSSQQSPSDWGKDTYIGELQTIRNSVTRSNWSPIERSIGQKIVACFNNPDLCGQLNPNVK